ncbi:MAG: DUF2281 domain-containing protein [Anaerolineales bacterium]|nr:DUF2281 domain-containing protein [Anaerolineales bacterium]MCB9128325.1 DUF2281 domain-containing protein [Ardenticatenales bacterium]MCB9172137.1 DUF2281 domain-containing protein [Ardenticatenales bacterium]
MTVKPLSELVQELPLYAQNQVRDFVESLLTKHHRESAGPLQQSWAGTLQAYRDQYSALDLQQKALEWRNE